MDIYTFNRNRMIFTGLVTAAELAHLAWEFFNGGVLSHNILADPNLPAISNWWGLLLLPALAWFLFGRLQPRLLSPANNTRPPSKFFPLSVVAAFLGAFAYGTLLSIAFRLDNTDAASYLALGMFGLGLFLPVYRPEYVLGFVLGMTFTFGAVLPTIVVAIVAAVSALAHFLIRFVRGLIQGRSRSTQPNG